MNYMNYESQLFCRGYLISDAEIELSDISFLNHCKKLSFNKYNIYVHNLQHIYYKKKDDSILFLIGNCVNPFTEQYDENEIVSDLFDAILSEKSTAQDKFNELTGSFFIGYINDDNFYFATDPTEMLFCTYATINGNLYISSHYQLIADLCKLSKNDYTKKLESYRFFYKYGLFFPGDKTPYSEVMRVLTNHIYAYKNGKINYKRFFPVEELIECKNEKEYKELIVKVSLILKSTMKCASKKWKAPAISLTGGMDSKTTLSSTKDIRDKFMYYSYCSMPGDKIDSDAAHKISEHLGIEHTVYNISENDADFEDIETQRAVLEYNTGGYRCNNNDVRKRAFFYKNAPFDVEIKSWISEIARANYYKKFGLKKMPEKLTPRQMTSMYKIFTTERKLAKETDLIFAEFIEKSKFNDIPKGYDASDMYLWEFRYSAWGGIVITSEHSYSNEIFIPYNNRKLLNMMLTAPKKKRISDQFHEDIIEYCDSKITETGITITNWNETKSRQIVEKIYFLLHSFFKHF